MNSFKKVSVVIPCYNDHLFIERCLNSVISQSYPNIEVIVVDDGSNNETKAILNSLRPKINRLLSQSNLGQSSARNNGIKAADGEFIFVLDSDDYIESSFVEKAVRQFELSSSIGLVSCYTKRISEKGDTFDLFEPKGGGLDSFLIYNSALSSMFYKNDWEKIGGYDEGMRDGFEDWEFYIRMMSLGFKAYIIPEVLLNYTIRKNSTTSRANKKKYELLKYIYTKHETLYKENYSELISHLLSRIEREEIEKLKGFDRIEYRIGKVLLTPVRYVKGLFYRVF